MQVEDRLIEPVTDATQALLEPLEFRLDEWLMIDLAEDPKYLLVEIVCGRRVDQAEWAARYAQSGLTEWRVGDDRIVPRQYVPKSSGAQEFIKRIPEAKLVKPSKSTNFDGRERWLFGCTDTSVSLIYSLWPKDRVIASADAQQVMDFLLRRLRAQQARAVLQAKFKINKEVPPAPHDFEAHPDFPLEDHQQVALQMGVGQEATGLFMDKGTGKTPVTIARICLEAKRTRAGRMGGAPRMMRVLVCCPPQARINWKNEIERFAVIGGKVARLKGGKSKRLRVLTHAIKTEDDCAFSVVIAGLDTAARDIELLKRIPWDLVVVDESQHIKSKGTKRWKNLIQLREVSSRRQILTGTPIGNSIFDLWAQLEFLGEGCSGFVNYKDFKAYHGQFKQGPRDAKGVGVEKLVGYRNIPLLQERLSRLTFQITKEEAGICMKTPKVPEWCEVNMTERQREIYLQLATTLQAQIDEQLAALDEDSPTANRKRSITTSHILTQLLRLAQITSGHVRWDPVFDLDTGECLEEGRVEYIAGENPKLEKLIELLRDPERDPNAKAVVWAQFVPDLKLISERLTKEGIKHALYYGGTSQNRRDELYQEFNNDPSMKVFVANAATAAEALNLIGYDYQNNPPTQPTFADMAIFFSVNWSFLQRSQAEDRIHRRGTRMPVRIVDLCVPGTIDEEMRLRVQKKGDMAMSVQDLREILTKLLEVEDAEDEVIEKEPSSDEDE